MYYYNMLSMCGKHIRSQRRRDVLKGLAGVGTVGLAGCTGGNGNGDSGGNGNGDSGEIGLTVATEFSLDVDDIYPIVQTDLRDNLESHSDGAIDVNLQPAGQLGTGGELAGNVQDGTVDIGQFSFANFSPYAPAVDLVNIPYFAGTNQEFVNLVTSNTWEEVVTERVRANGFEPLFYLLLDPRVLALRSQMDDPVLVPSDAADVNLNHRIPSSEMLEQMWNLAGASPTPVAWGETPSAISEGVADSLHVATQALVGAGFTDLVGHITLINAVMDCQVYAMNKERYDNLPDDIRAAVDQAAEDTFRRNLEEVVRTRENSIGRLREAGATFHELNDSQRSEWVEAIGQQRDEWDSFKEDLAGDLETAEELREAATTQSEFDAPEFTVPPEGE